MEIELLKALREGNIDKLKTIIDSGFDINSEIDGDEFPLTYSIEKTKKNKNK